MIMTVTLINMKHLLVATVTDITVEIVVTITVIIITSAVALLNN